jgi:hypothetical protein
VYATDERGNKVIRQKKEVTMEKLKSLFLKIAHSGERILSSLTTRSMLLLMGVWQAAAHSDGHSASRTGGHPVRPG